jgi:hypothetical protein
MQWVAALSPQRYDEFAITDYRHVVFAGRRLRSGFVGFERVRNYIPRSTVKLAARPFLIEAAPLFEKNETLAS